MNRYITAIDVECPVQDCSRWAGPGQMGVPGVRCRWLHKGEFHAQREIQAIWRNEANGWPDPWRGITTRKEYERWKETKAWLALLR